jgi:hypothetical protein
MRCCASPTTCSVDSVAAHRTAEMIEAMLIAPVLRPLIDGAGIVGDYELDLLAQEVARRDEGGFAGILASRLEGTP